MGIEADPTACDLSNQVHDEALLTREDNGDAQEFCFRRAHLMMLSWVPRLVDRQVESLKDLPGDTDFTVT